MKSCIVEIYTQTSSFRNPEFQTFHKTLTLPPPTSIIGLAGAALGLSPKSSQDFFEDEFKLGIYGKSEGISKDLWKYRYDKTEKNITQYAASIIKKEFLYNNYFIIVFSSDNLEKINQLKNAFQNPYYSLTLGNSDSLALIKNISVIDKMNFDESKEIEFAILEGNILDEVISNKNNGFEFSIYSTSDPIVYDLPIRFKYENEYGFRNVSKRKTFSMIGKKMLLNINKCGLFYKNIFIPVFKL
jgi:CRISPR-associated protein Cas5t